MTIRIDFLLDGSAEAETARILERNRLHGGLLNFIAIFPIFDDE